MDVEHMPVIIEGLVVDPQYWLARTDCRNSYASNNLFVKRATEKTAGLLQNFRRQYPIRTENMLNSLSSLDKSPLGRATIAISATFVIFSIGWISSAFIESTLSNVEPGGRDRWVINEEWLNNNCGSDGKARETRITYRKYGRDTTELRIIIKYPLTESLSDEIIGALDNVNTSMDAANLLCNSFPKKTDP